MPEPDWSAAAGAGAPPLQAAPREDALTLLTWNIEWFGDAARGPDDEPRQLAIAADALGYAQADLVALQEVSSPDAAAALVEALPGYGIEAAHYAQAQKVALLYRRDRLELLERSAIEGLDDAGRPPLEARFRTRAGRELVAIALHAKAGDDPASYATRAGFAEGLAGALERRHAGADVVLLGDFNDRMSGSTLERSPSPYESLTASGAFVAATSVLELGPERSTVWGATVDHIVVSRSLAASVIHDSVEVLRDELLARHGDFFDAASDHAPVVLELRL